MKNPNGSGKGWLAKDKGVWVPTPNMHGGEGWTVQYPDGSHSHAYPGGKMRNHFQAESTTDASFVIALVGSVVTFGLIADDITGIGVMDNSLIAGSFACFAGGMSGLRRKQVCSICGEEKYGC